LASSNSRLRAAGRALPARLMKYRIMRMPEPIPLGLTFLLPITRAMVRAPLVNRSLGGNVETVFTPRTQCFFSAMAPSCRSAPAVAIRPGPRRLVGPGEVPSRNDMQMGCQSPARPA